MNGSETPYKEQATRAWPEHSCYDWNRQHYLSTPEYLASQCGTCGHITGFRWRKPRRRLVSLFTSEPTLRKAARFMAWHWSCKRRQGRA